MQGTVSLIPLLFVILTHLFFLIQYLYSMLVHTIEKRMIVMEEYSFRFHITDSYPLQNENDKIEAVVRTKIKHADRGCLYEGYLRVHITKIGVFPVAKDIAEAISIRSLRQQLAAELKRYVRPHRNFL
jgi:hypothetical protein